MPTAPIGPKAPTRQTRRVILLGSTGSIGAQTIEVVEHLAAMARARDEPPPLRIVALAAGANADALFRQAKALGVRDAALALAPRAPLADEAQREGLNLRTGDDASERLIVEVAADLVVNAIVGVAGLKPTLAAIDAGRDLATANKETLVAAGELVVARARAAGVAILPIDSEHSGVWQCLPGRPAPPLALDDSVRRVTLTASGGPFRDASREAIYNATPEQALDHPTWTMGAKVTIDSASLTNKGLELIEAHWLFGVGADRLSAVVHPQSIVHAIVEFADGSIAAQLGSPDMRGPIQHALTHPDIQPGCVQRLDPTRLGSLEFSPPDTEKFPALQTARRVIEVGGVAGAVFNAANERAVEAFLDRRIPFGRIPALSGQAVASLAGQRRLPALRDLADVLQADAEARRYVDQAIARAASQPSPRLAKSRSAARTAAE